MLGAYLQVFRNNGKQEFVIQKFRAHYPDSPLYIVSDNGDDFSDLAKKYNCFYEHSNFNTGVEHAGYTLEQTKVWLSRLKNAFEYCENSEVMLYMEDDVLIRDKIKINTNYDICGVMAGNIPSQHIEYFENKYKIKFNSYNYGTCGGAIYNRRTFLKIYDSIVKIIEEDLPEINKRYIFKFGYQDLYMPVTYMINGYNYYNNDDLIESNRNSNWQFTQHSIVHGKNIYDK